MSLLNITNDGLHNVLVVICGALIAQNGRLSEQDLLRRVAPEPLVPDSGKMARQTLNRWADLGLLVREDDKIHLSAYFPPAKKVDAKDIVSVVRKAARKCALSPDNNVQLWAKEGARAADLTRSLCLLLAQDVYRTDFGQLEALENEQVTDSELRLVQNDTRLNGLRKWSYFLGFVRQPEGGDIDPTVAVRESIEEWMPRGQSLLANDFLTRLAADLPVLDRGTYRIAVEEKLNRQKLFVPSSGQVSSSLSRALLALKASGELIFEMRSDVGEGVVLVGQSGPRADLRYTHILRPAE